MRAWERNRDDDLMSWKRRLIPVYRFYPQHGWMSQNFGDNFFFFSQRLCCEQDYKPLEVVQILEDFFGVQVVKFLHFNFCGIQKFIARQWTLRFDREKGK